MRPTAKTPKRKRKPHPLDMMPPPIRARAVMEDRVSCRIFSMLARNFGWPMPRRRSVDSLPIKIDEMEGDRG